MDIEIPGYKMLSTLGKGGMATVFLAVQETLERKVALKVLSKSLAEDTEFGQRFMREAKIVSQLVHRHIVTVHEVGLHEGHYFLSMEYIDGHDLRTVRKKLDVAGKVGVIKDIAQALHYAGEKGYVHRDIKPENIMFRTIDGSAVLTDFGIAKAVESDLSMTQAGTAIGTPHYMSPEQAKGKAVDKRSDLYSLGVVFYLLLVGKVPYDAESAVSIGVKHITEPLPVLPAVFERYQDVIDCLLAKNPRDRYQDGRELFDALCAIPVDDLSGISGNVDTTGLNTFARDSDSGFNGISTELPTAISDSFDEAPEDSSRFTLQFEIEESIEPPVSSFFPMFYASLFVLCSLSFFIYMARPQVLEPFILEVEHVASKSYLQAKDKAQKGMAFITEKVKALTATKEDETKAKNVKSSAIESATHERSLAVSGPSAEDVLTERRARLEMAQKKTPTFEVSVPNPVKTDDNKPSLAVMQRSIELALQHSDDSPDAFTDYVDTHHQLLEHYPGDQNTHTSLAQLSAERRTQILALAEKGHKKAVDGQLSLYARWFPAEGGTTNDARFRQDVDRALTLHGLIEKAERYQRQGAILSPSGRNAVAIYRQVLALDKTNQAAKRALQAIADDFAQKATVALKAERYQQAKTFSLRSRQVNAGNRRATEILEILEQRLKKAELITSSLERAQKYQNLGYLYAPKGRCAYDQYQAVLEIDSKNIQAIEGTRGLFEALSTKIWALLSEENFESAEKTLARPKQLFPGNARIQTLQSAINDIRAR